MLCPLYAAGEKKNKKFTQVGFGKLISTMSNRQVIIIRKPEEIGNYLKKNLISNEIIIGMGAGSISKWMKELKTVI